jgi:hypothetical protein
MRDHDERSRYRQSAPGGHKSPRRCPRAADLPAASFPPPVLARAQCRRPRARSGPRRAGCGVLASAAKTSAAPVAIGAAALGDSALPKQRRSGESSSGEQPDVKRSHPITALSPLAWARSARCLAAWFAVARFYGSKAACAHPDEQGRINRDGCREGLCPASWSEGATNRGPPRLWSRRGSHHPVTLNSFGADRRAGAALGTRDQSERND